MATTAELQSAYPELGPSFLGDVRGYCAGKRFSDWELLALMDFESAYTFDPGIWNGEGYVGLIQFGDAAAADLGTTTQALSQMSRLEQLGYVFDYLDLRQSRYGPLRDLGDLYSAVLWPPGIGKPGSYVFFFQGDGYYGPNAKLDRDNDGTVTKAEAVSRVADLLRGGDADSSPPPIIAGVQQNPLLAAAVLGLAAAYLTSSLTA